MVAMEDSQPADNNPFADPPVAAHLQARPHDLSLDVGRSASLTLGTDSLIVLDESSRELSRLTCCGLRPAFSKKTRTIPYFNILWASLTKAELSIQYARPAGKTHVHVATLTQTLDPSTSREHIAGAWVAQLLDRAYPQSQRLKRIKLLINPFSGAGRASTLYRRDIKPIFTAARCQVDEEQTSYRNHAAQIAEGLDVSAYDVIACCSGDGLPHEVFNGLAKKDNAAEALRKVAVVQLPCGTGNAMSWNLNGTGSCSMAALAVVKGISTPLDLVSVTQGEKRIISFLSQAIGIVAETDLGTDNIRWMGSARFVFGFLVRLLGKTVYPCELAIKTEIPSKGAMKAHYHSVLSEHHQNLKLPASDSASTLSRHGDSNTHLSKENQQGLPPLKYGTVSSPLPPDWTLTPYPTLGNFYSGNMPIMTESATFFPASLPSDGLLDLLIIDGNIGRVKALASLNAVENGTFFDLPYVRMRKVSAFRVVPRFGKWAPRSPASSSSPSSTPPIPEQKKSRMNRLAWTLLTGLSITGGGSSSSSNNQDGGYISVDGEKMPFEPFQVEVHHGLGTVLSRSGYVYEAQGPTGWETAVTDDTDADDDDAATDTTTAA